MQVTVADEMQHTLFEFEFLGIELGDFLLGSVLHEAMIILKLQETQLNLHRVELTLGMLEEERLHHKQLSVHARYHSKVRC